MKKTKIILAYSSHLPEDHDQQFEKHVSSTIGVDHSIHRYVNNNEFSLPEVYNRALNELASEDAIIVFSHNDIEFDTLDWGNKLLAHFNNPHNDYQIIGVAGATELYEHGCWWQTRNNQGMNMSKMVGIVNHFNGVRKWTSYYSNKPYFGIKPVVLVDGLFIAVDPSDIEESFVEDFIGFHFYDVSFCVENYLSGCNIGVITDIRITHKSIGQTNQQWENNRMLFAEKYKADLPLIVE
jgi:hypothetical protein